VIFLVKKKQSKKTTAKVKSENIKKEKSQVNNIHSKTEHHMIKKTVAKKPKVSKSQEKKDIFTIIALSVLIVIIIIISIISGNNSKDIKNIDADLNLNLNTDAENNTENKTDNKEESFIDQNLSEEEVIQKATDLQLQMFGEIKDRQLEIFELWYDELGIDSSEMNACLEENNYLNMNLNIEDSKIISKIHKDIQLASASGFTGTPGLFVNNYKIDGFKDFEYIEKLILAAQNDLENNMSVVFDNDVTDFNANTTGDSTLYIIYNKDYDFTKEYVDSMLELLEQEPYGALFEELFEDIDVLKLDYKETNQYITNVLSATEVNSLPFFYLDGDVESLLETYDEETTSLFDSLFVELPIGGYMLAIPPQQILDYSILHDEEDYKYGDENTPVTLYIFDDYDCAYCYKLDNEVLPELISKYVDNSVLNIVVKDFVIYQTQSLFPAIFSRCAQEQNKYWEVHTKLFENRSLFGGSLVQEIYSKYETQISNLQEQYNKFQE
jgi:protein-disulfide isomerase